MFRASIPPWATALFLCLLLALPSARAEVPASYKELYSSMERTLDESEAQIGTNPLADWKPVFSTDLLAANSNRGSALLQPQALPAVRLSLDRFKAMGIQSVKFALQYPMLLPYFPRSGEYLEFYRQVVQEAHARGIKVMPNVTVLFANAAFNPFKGIYSDLNLEKFKREYRDMVHLVVRELQPEYLGIITEPDTQARLTGLRELEQPEKVAEVVRFALDGLERGKTLLGAGSGSWSPPAFAKALAEGTDVDFIAIHIYPLTPGTLDNAVQMARIARANRKQAFIDEAWLYKAPTSGSGGGLAASADAFRRDIYAFWQPLDQKFMRLIVRLAKTEQISLVSFFWSSYFFAYLDYAPELDRLSYQEVARKHNRYVTEAMGNGTLSATGEYYRSVITGAGKK